MSKKSPLVGLIFWKPTALSTKTRLYRKFSDVLYFNDYRISLMCEKSSFFFPDNNSLFYSYLFEVYSCSSSERLQLRKNLLNKAPFSPPDCPWEPMSPGSTKPESLCDLGGKLNGEKVYVGRVYDDGCYLVGTAIPSKGICTYLSKKLEVKTTDTYDILTVACGEPLVFRPMDLDSNLLFVSGGDEDQCLYCSRVVDGESTYYGWADKDTKTVYIPRESNNKLTQGYDILIHQYLDRLCICPTPPNPPPF